MTPKHIQVLERVVLRGIEGQIGDSYLKAVLKGNTDVLADYYEAPCMAEQVYMSWKGYAL